MRFLYSIEKFHIVHDFLKILMEFLKILHDFRAKVSPFRNPSVYRHFRASSTKIPLMTKSLHSFSSVHMITTVTVTISLVFS